MRVLKKKKNYIWAVIGVLLVGHAIYYHKRYALCANSTISCITYPFLRTYRFFADLSCAWYQTILDRTDLRTTIRGLEVRNAALLAENNALKATACYETAIADLIAFKKRYALEQAFVAQVLTITCNEYEQTMVVTGGSRNGITKNMVALLNNCLVGKVIEVYPWYCKVRLITDAKSKVSVYCAESGALGIYHGHNNNDPSIEHLSHLDQVHQGDLVVSSGKGSIFPQGFVLGTIASVIKQDLYYRISVKPMIESTAISYCLLVSKSTCENLG